MADINWDGSIPNPSSLTFGLRSNTLKSRAMYTGALRTFAVPGARWFFMAEWDMLGRAQGDALRALLVKMRGSSNRLLLWDLAQPVFRGVGGGSPVVNGASQTGSTLAITGCPASTNNWALPGDKFSVNGELKMIVAAANTNGSGQTTLTFEPYLRASPSNSAPLTITQPTAKFVLATEAAWTYSTELTTMIAVEGEEAFA
jgi:hypothetical protein